MMQLDSKHIGLLTLIAGKAFIMAARSMPPLAPDASYGARWIHDFLQMASSNPDKVGETTQSASAAKEAEAKSPPATLEVPK